MRAPRLSRRSSTPTMVDEARHLPPRFGEGPCIAGELTTATRALSIDRRRDPLAAPGSLNRRRRLVATVTRPGGKHQPGADKKKKKKKTKKKKTNKKKEKKKKKKVARLSVRVVLEIVLMPGSSLPRTVPACVPSGHYLARPEPRARLQQKKRGGHKD